MARFPIFVNGWWLEKDVPNIEWHGDSSSMIINNYGYERGEQEKEELQEEKKLFDPIDN